MLHLPVFAVILSAAKDPKNSIGPESPNLSAQTSAHSDSLC
jgi:hypothetical protein